jgi:hypothetical protein
VNFTAAACSVLVPAPNPSVPVTGEALTPPPEPVLLLAASVLELLRAKEAAASVSALLDASPIADALTRTVIVAHCIFMHGRANFKHAQTLLERYKELFVLDAGSPSELSSDMRAHAVLSAAWQVWRRARHVALALCDLLCQVGLVTPAQLVAFALAPLVRFPLDHWHATDEAVAVRPTEGEEGAAARLEFACARSLSLSWWEAVHRALELSVARATAARVELAVFRGSGVLDTNVAELDEDEASAKEAELCATASGADAAAARAVGAVFEHASATVALLLHATMDHSDRHSEHAARYAEAARVVLAHVRGVSREHAATVQLLHTRGDLDAAIASCSHISRIVAATVAYAPSVRAIPSPLIRDTVMPMPGPVTVDAPDAA